MIAYEDILSLNFYTYGQAFSGSYKGMRYRIIQLKEKKDDDGNVLQKKALEACLWPEPFSFEKTMDSKKTFRQFDFSEEGKISLVDWMNAFYESGSWNGELPTMSGLKKLKEEEESQ